MEAIEHPRVTSKIISTIYCSMFYLADMQYFDYYIVNSTDQKLFMGGLFHNSFMGSDLYFVGLAAYITGTITRITRSLHYSSNSMVNNQLVARCADVDKIRPNEWRSSVVTSDATTGSMDCRSITSTSIHAIDTLEECESIYIQIYFIIILQLLNKILFTFRLIKNII